MTREKNKESGVYRKWAKGKREESDTAGFKKG
jgi:hypothetical protein